MGAKWWLRWGHNETPLMDPDHYRKPLDFGPLIRVFQDFGVTVNAAVAAFGAMFGQIQL